MFAWLRLIADAFELQAAMWVVAAMTFVSGAVSAVRMTETLPVRPATLANDDDTRTVRSPHQLALGARRPE